MKLFSTFGYSSLTVLTRISSLIVINKVLSIFVGPSGYALVSQLQNIISILLNFSSTFLNNGITKYTSEYNNDERKQNSIWSASLSIGIALTAVCSIFLVTCSNLISNTFLGSDTYAFVFTSFGITLIFFVLNSFIMAILNGKKEVKLFTKINILGSLLSLFITVFLTISFSLKGALLALVINQSLVFFISYFYIRKLDWFKNFNFQKDRLQESIKKLLAFASIAIVVAFLTPLIQILIRDMISETYGWDSAGYWDGVTKISSYSALFMTSIMTIYFLPRYSEINNPRELTKEIFNGFLFVAPVLFLVFTILYVFRNQVIVILFTNDFLQMESLFFWQLVGDFFKTLSWLLSYVLLAKAMTKILVISEILLASLFYLSSIYLIEIYEITGVTMAYALSSLLYLVLMFVILAMRGLIRK